jgi:hypothetical protein
MESFQIRSTVLFGEETDVQYIQDKYTFYLLISEVAPYGIDGLASIN